MKNLVIVESPTKAKTISKFLPSGFQVESSFGHVRDLPEKEMGVDTENDFKPKYVIPAKAQARVTKLKKLAQHSEKIWFATDADREGEAIAWHLASILKPKDSARIAFHEITKSAVQEALKEPRSIDQNLVDAQQARRVLDRLVGYELSPFLWKKVAKGLSAGRVQSVAVRLVVDREREIEKFKAEEYWTIEAIFQDKKANQVTAKLHSCRGKILKKMGIKNEADAKALTEELQRLNYKISQIETKTVKKSVPEPFRTSTLQQEANTKLGFSSKETMMLAQQLYEGVKINEQHLGLITYMRTDSLNLADAFLQASQQYIKETFGADYAPEKPRHFKTKSKGAQEAHEAIRPTDLNNHPDELKSQLSPKQFKLYNLIWRRTLASQMTEALLDATTLDIASDKNEHLFRATGQTIKFDGFLKVYTTVTKENLLPAWTEGQSLEAQKISPEQHFTQPPARYTEASLVKVLEEYGIGRPSTYAPTLSTIIERKYVVKEERKLKPTDIGVLVTDILVEHFPQIADYKFTAEMEQDLDEIAEGHKAWVPVIKQFYGPFEKNLKEKYETLSKKELTEEKTTEVCEKCGAAMVIKTGRFGRFLACSSYPKCKNTKKVNGSDNAPTALELTNEICPDCGAPLASRRGKYGPFLGCSRYPDCRYIKNSNQSTGIACPLCGKGEIVSRRSRFKKIFYSCDQYPTCKFALWGKPTGEHCKVCHSLLIEGPKKKIICSHKDCASNQKEK